MSDHPWEPRAPSVPAAANAHIVVRQAFAGFFELEFRAVVRFLMMNHGATLEDSQDAAQEAFHEAWRLVDGQPSEWLNIRSPEAWIRGVATRALARPRGQRRKQPWTFPVGLEHPEQDRSSADCAEEAALAVDVQNALDKLPQDQKFAIICRMDDISYADIAEQLGVTEQKTRDLVKRARSIMAVALAAHSDREEDVDDRLRK